MASHLGAKMLTVHYQDQMCSLRLFEGVEPSALAHALASRLGLDDERFYLTLRGEEDVIALSAMLPDGLTLSLHRRPTAGEGSSVGVAPAPAAKLQPPGCQGSASCASASSLSHEPSTQTPSKHIPSHSHHSFKVPEHPKGDDARLLTAEAMHSHVPSAAQSFCHSHTAMDDAVINLDRFSRLSTDLANERTLLAWIRTGLAAMRTTFSFYSLWAIKLHSVDVLWLCQMAMALSVVVGGFSGWTRYAKIKKACFMPMPPVHFGRVSIRHFAVLVTITSVAVFLAVCNQGVRSVFNPGDDYDDSSTTAPPTTF